ncbi:type VII secretion target [Actinoplanes sp. NPDC051851]|uniref:type VII secretion target n=1 Tax=Actinoplanes sp. NPDC051851 TaxID=3154753 RepID=UPI003416F30D
MSGDRLRLPSDEMVRHSSAVDDIAAALRQARAAAGQVSLDTQAYGRLCSFLPLLLGGVTESAIVAMNGSADALTETALRLREAVATTEHTDHLAAQDIGEAGLR